MLLALSYRHFERVQELFGRFGKAGGDALEEDQDDMR